MTEEQQIKLSADGRYAIMTPAQLGQIKEAKDWYETTCMQAELATKPLEELKSKIEAALKKEKKWFHGKDEQPLPARDRIELVKAITMDLANAKGQMADTIFGGKVITTQYVANVLSHMPDGVYFDAARADIEDKVRKEMKRHADDIIKLAIAAAIVLGAIALAAVILSRML